MKKTPEYYSCLYNLKEGESETLLKVKKSREGLICEVEEQYKELMGPYEDAILEVAKEFENGLEDVLEVKCSLEMNEVKVYVVVKELMPLSKGSTLKLNMVNSVLTDKLLDDFENIADIVDGFSNVLNRELSVNMEVEVPINKAIDTLALMSSGILRDWAEYGQEVEDNPFTMDVLSMAVTKMLFIANPTLNKSGISVSEQVKKIAAPVIKNIFHFTYLSGRFEKYEDCPFNPNCLKELSGYILEELWLGNGIVINEEARKKSCTAFSVLDSIMSVFCVFLEEKERLNSEKDFRYVFGFGHAFGCIYVDGLGAQNHKFSGLVEYDDVLEEVLIATEGWFVEIADHFKKPENKFIFENPSLMAVGLCKYLEEGLEEKYLEYEV
ncbi:hypothetical protein LCL98_22070 [Rossellomorea aquimaris]|nr:hypothetical protein [Rossellomorea aquimaris]